MRDSFLLGNILKDVIYSQVSSYLDDYNILSKDQSGFGKGYSTGTCLTDFLDNAFLNIDQLVPIVECSSWISEKAVDPKILIDKLRFIGLWNSSLTWFISYMPGRSQVMKVDGVLSSSISVICGIPQGHILGPLLFFFLQ